MKFTPKIIAFSIVGLLAACSGNETAHQPASSAAAPQTAPIAASEHVQAASNASAEIVGVDVRKDDLGGDFTLTGSDGKPFKLSDLKGKVVVLAFGFTNCPDVCPTELVTYKDAMAQLGDDAKKVAVVFVSVDPERDTPALIGKYVHQFDPNFIGLTDTNGGKDVAYAKQLFRIVSAKTEIKSDKLYNVDHSSGAYILDKNGNAAVFARYGMEAPQLATEIKKILAE